MFKTGFLLLACLVVAVLAADQETSEPGSVTRQDCDSCMCSEDGKTRIYTLIKCETTKPVCELGQTVIDDCNYCTCGMNGHGWVCTSMTCPPQVCRPGSTYRKFCNSCTCESHGFSVACTKKHCPEEIFNEDGRLKHSEQVTDNPLVRRRRQVSDDRPYVPGKRFKNYCNTCICGSDGFSVACTRKASPKEIFNEDGSLHLEQVMNNPLVRRRRQVRDDRPYVLEKRFKNYCNTCICGSDGFSVACTRKASPKEVFNEDGNLKHPDQVTDNPLVRRWRQVSDDRPCVPGERFENYCNTCICGSDGFSVACTKKHCPEEIFNEDGSLKQPEQVTDNPLVRRRLQVSDDRPCVPGERIKNYCNTCICGSDGFSVACTKKYCPEEIFNEDDSLKQPEQVTDNPLVRRGRQISE